MAGSDQLLLQFDQSPQFVDDITFIDSEDLPPYHTINNGDLFNLSLSLDTTDLTHGLHRFAAKYIPQIPRWAIKEFSQDGGTVMDPFMGSGTTLVEALTFNRKAIGLDIDPLAHLIASAKISCPSSSRIIELGVQLKEGWLAPAAELVSPMPDVVNFEHWFTHDAWTKLQALLFAIDALECTDDERSYILVVFSSILRLVSNADDQSQKTYVSGTNPKTPPEVRETFWKFYAKAIKRLQKLEKAKHRDAVANIDFASDALAIHQPAASVDLMVTSPPYLDSVDYMYNFMAEYFWLGPRLGIANRKEFNLRRKEPVGAKNPVQTRPELPSAVAQIVKEAQLAPERNKAAVGYLTGMHQHMREAASVLKTGAYYVMVVGNSQTKEGILPVHDCLVALAAHEGLHLDKAFGYRIRRHYMKFPRKGRGGIILIDWILVFRKDQRAQQQHQALPLPWAALHNDAVAH